MISYKYQIFHYSSRKYANDIFDIINKYNMDGTPHKTQNILGKILSLYDKSKETVEKEFLSKFFFDIKKRNDCTKIKAIVLASPNELMSIKKEIEEWLILKKFKSTYGKFYGEFKTLFINSYNSFRGNDEVIGVYIDMLQDLNWSTCPNCNHVKLLKTKHDKKVFSGTLDHFF